MDRGTLLGRLNWQIGKVVATRPETPRARSISLVLPTWIGHRAGQHVDVRLTSEDGYQAERSYSIASPPEEAPRVTLTVERLADGEVSPSYKTLLANDIVNRMKIMQQPDLAKKDVMPVVQSEIDGSYHEACS